MLALAAKLKLLPVLKKITACAGTNWFSPLIIVTGLLKLILGILYSIPLLNIIVAPDGTFRIVSANTVGLSAIAVKSTITPLGTAFVV
ncbi:hypothetical protein D3C86_1072730 [compost metagenome]